MDRLAVRLILVFVVAILVSACDGSSSRGAQSSENTDPTEQNSSGQNGNDGEGSGGDPVAQKPPANPEQPQPEAFVRSERGIWSGTFIEDGVGFDGAGLIYGDELLFVTSSGLLLRGAYTRQGDQLTSQIAIFEATGELSRQANATATVVDGESISGDFTSAGLTGTIALTYEQAQYERGANLSTLAGIWSVSDDSGYALTLTINNDGSVNGSDTMECMYLGTATIPDAAVNVYALALDISSCGSRNGSYTGYGVLGDDQTENDTFIAMIGTDIVASAATLVRQD